MMLEAANINKSYGTRPALDNVSFSIGKGETVGFLGINGAGKSTTMRMFTGFLTPTRGTVRVAGGNPRNAAVRQKIGYLPESNPLPGRMRVGEYLRFRAGLKGFSRQQTLAAIAETAHLCHTDGMLDRMIAHLSKGMRQRVGLTESMLGKPEVLILDEPTAGLDPHQAAETRELIARIGEGATVFLSSHILGDIERLCRRVIILDQGRIAADGDLAAICEQTVTQRSIKLECIASGKIKKDLLAIPGVSAVTVTSDPTAPDCLSAHITTPAGTDVRQALAQLCAQKGWLITGMKLEPVRLEDIFRKLTQTQRN